jgi:hypothetical protein
MADSGAAVVLPCPVCGRRLRAPADRGTLWLTCPACHHRWAWVPADRGILSSPTPDYYEILQVSANADPEVIEAALRQLAKKYHPDRNIGDPSAEQTMKLIIDAKETLCDPSRRRAYDEKRRAERADNRRTDETDIIAGMSRAAAEHADEQRCHRPASEHGPHKYASRRGDSGSSVTREDDPAGPKTHSRSTDDATVPKWYVIRDGKGRAGPYRVAELQQHVALGKLSRTDLVWMEGRDILVTADSLCGLFPPRTPSVSPVQEPTTSVTPAQGTITSVTYAPRTAFQNWVTAWTVASLIVAVVGISGGDWFYLVKAPVACVLLFAIIAGVYYSKPPCPGCAARWAGEVWDHPRKNGGPDLRYKNNHRRCTSCGHAR